ncbi:MAG TPA: hypothetical protein VGR14_22370, partial [Verrucomicrobiae bacterium]|nr:hypothetical protein [Verrucomicrobiae bacterium]
MSTHIIDKIAAVKVPKERSGYIEDYYFLATLSGDNNVICSQTRRRARSWHGWTVGAHWRCLSRMCEISSGFCGGCIRMANGRATPESFIKKCRETLDTAPDYDSPHAAFRLENPAITFDPPDPAKPGYFYQDNDGGAREGKYYFDQLVEKKGQPQERDAYLRGTV